MSLNGRILQQKISGFYQWLHARITSAGLLNLVKISYTTTELLQVEVIQYRGFDLEF